MIAKFNTAGLSSTTSKGGGNSLIYLVGAVALAVGVYYFVIKPKEDKSKTQEVK